MMVYPISTTLRWITAFAPAIAARTADAVNGADSDTAKAKHQLSPGPLQDFHAADALLVELDAESRYIAVAVVNYQAGPVGSVGLGRRQ
jgi:hypothetical protein